MGFFVWATSDHKFFGFDAMDSRLHRIFAGGGSGGGPHPDSPLVDSSEQVYISSLALLKMLKHGTLLES